MQGRHLPALHVGLAAQALQIGEHRREVGVVGLEIFAPVLPDLQLPGPGAAPLLRQRDQRLRARKALDQTLEIDAGGARLRHRSAQRRP